MIRAAVKLTDRDRSWAGFYAQFTRKPYPTTGAVDRTRHADDAASTPDPGSRAVAPSINDMPSAYVSVPSYNDNKTSGRAPTAPAPEVMEVLKKHDLELSETGHIHGKPSRALAALAEIARGAKSAPPEERVAVIEECAKVAENLPLPDDPPPHQPKYGYAKGVQYAVADAIRSLTAKQEG